MKDMNGESVTIKDCVRLPDSVIILTIIRYNKDNNEVILRPIRPFDNAGNGTGKTIIKPIEWLEGTYKVKNY